MDPEEIRQLLLAHPFAPFVVHTTDGAEYHVVHPERAMLTDETLYLYQDRHTTRCALINISRVVAPDATQEVP